jgi:hypothetical protein
MDPVSTINFLFNEDTQELTPRFFISMMVKIILYALA